MLIVQIGATSTGKTSAAINRYYELPQGMVRVMKPSSHTRDGLRTIKNRAGATLDVDVVLEPKDRITSDMFPTEVKMVIVDEFHALTRDQAKDLILLSLTMDVYCYGLDLDFRGEIYGQGPFLACHADTIVRPTRKCMVCHQGIARYSMRYLDGKPTISTILPQTEEGGDEKYKPTCRLCFFRETRCFEEEKEESSLVDIKNKCQT